MLANDDLLVVQRGSCGRVGHFRGVEQEATINPSLVVLKRLRVLPRFLFYVLNSDFVQRQFSLFTSATAVPMLSQEQIGDVALALPDPGTQDRIAAFLDRETARIDALVAKVREAIDRLKEIRTALISAAVTGKTDVREEVT
jgi:restriction endonuclease S subunit